MESGKIRTKICFYHEIKDKKYSNNYTVLSFLLSPSPPLPTSNHNFLVIPQKWELKLYSDS